MFSRFLQLFLIQIWMNRPTVMNDNRLRNFGLGFAIFGFGLNLGVKIATGAPINWQPNIPTAVFLLVLSCASIIVGLSIIAVSLCREILQMSVWTSSGHSDSLSHFGCLEY